MSAPERYGAGRANLARAIKDAVRRNLSPPPRLTLSQWAERFAYLSAETSAQTGKFHAFPYQNGIMDAVTDPSVHTVTVKKSARVGYTKIVDHIAGYYVHQDPSPVFIVQPRIEDAEDYMESEIEPMIRDTPVLAALAGEAKSRDSKQTKKKRSFRNGSSIRVVGANSPGGFRRITARIIILDEVNGYPVRGAGTEGDQVKLAAKRGESFWNRKLILGSTPTVKKYSRITRSWETSDQRFFNVPCPHCGEFQVLEWGGKDTPHGLKWLKDEETGAPRPETAHFVCRHNGCVIEEIDKPAMIGRGEWRATKPFAGHAGFHIWAGYSLFPNASWSILAREWLEVKDDPLARQTFINLVLGEDYEDAADRALEEGKIAARAEMWPEEVVPAGVAVLTLGVDVQDYRIELELTGWGRNEESWSLDYVVIDGEFSDPLVQDELDQYLKRTWERADGRKLSIAAAAIDSGGHHTQAVYGFSKARLGRRIWAIKGESARMGQRSPVWPTKRPSRRTKAAFRPVIIGTNTAKDVIRQRLHIDAPGPGFMHFPASRDLGYYQQLIAERSVARTLNGQRFRVWELIPGRANEALDCRVYAYAALQGLVHLGLQLNRLAPPEPPPPRPAPISAAGQLPLAGAATTHGPPRKSLASRMA